MTRQPRLAVCPRLFSPAIRTNQGNLLILRTALASSKWMTLGNQKYDPGPDGVV